MITAFCGEYKCGCDAKGRMFLPSKMRDVFSEGTSVVLVRSLDRCINVYTEEKWQVYADKIEALPPTEARDVKRFFWGSMQSVEADSQGRILIPQELRAYASIDRQVSVVGCGDHAEIWDENKYSEYVSQEKSESVEEILKRNGL